MDRPFPDLVELGGFSTPPGPRTDPSGLSSAIDLRQIRFAVAAAEHGGFRRAAEALNVQQSALSRRIAELEHHLGVRLFERLPFGVRLTREGRRFLENARAGLDQIGRAGRAAGEAARQERNTLRIGLAPGLVPEMFLKTMSAVLGRRPKQQLMIEEASARHHRLALANQTLDLAILPGRPRWGGCDSRVVQRARLVLACQADHRLATKTAIHWPDLRDECLLTVTAEPGAQIAQHVESRLAARGCASLFRPQAVGPHTLLHLVGMGQGLAVMVELPGLREVSGVVFRPISGEDWPFTALWSTQNAKPAVRRLLGSVQDDRVAAAARACIA